MVRKLAKIAFFIGLVAVIALSLLPQETLPETGTWDKLNHALAYGVLAVLGGFGFEGWRSLLMVGLGLVVLGAGVGTGAVRYARSRRQHHRCGGQFRWGRHGIGCHGRDEHLVSRPMAA